MATAKEEFVKHLITAIQTGTVRVRTAQRARKPGGLLRVLTDSDWAPWLPIYAWLIDHPEGPIVVDTGETAKTAEAGYFPWWHPYYRRAVRMDVKPEDEIGPQLNQLGLKQNDIRTVIMTHLHTDHAGGLAHFPESRVLVSGNDYAQASGLGGRLLGYLPNRWPEWFDPEPVAFGDEAFGPFDRSFALTKAKDVILLPTPGHTPGHFSVAVIDEDIVYFLAGDTSYSQQLHLEGIPDGVSPNPATTMASIDRITALANERAMIYLPSHDPNSEQRLQNREIFPTSLAAITSVVPQPSQPN